jgi:hypothetical protein
MNLELPTNPDQIISNMKVKVGEKEIVGEV